MKREAMLRYWLAVVLVLTAVLLSISAYLLWVVFPHGYFPSRAIWVDIHKWTGLILTVGVVFHVTIHRKWLSQSTIYYLRMLFKNKGK